MTKNTFSNYDTPTQIAEKKQQNREKNIRLAILGSKCNSYSVFLRSDQYDKSDINKTVDRQCDHIQGIALAAMECYHPGTTEFIEILESE